MDPTANLVWTFLPSGSPFSAMRVPNHRDQYDVTSFYKLLVQVFSFYFMVVASSRLKMVSQILQLILYTGFHGLRLFGAKHFHLCFYLNSSFVHALSQFLLHIFLLSSFDKAWSQVFRYLCLHQHMLYEYTDRD
jgi:hypothetical protein